MKAQNIFLNIPHNPEKELFEPLVKHDMIVIERIISKGQKSPESGWYDQEKNEWVMVLQGKAVLSFEDQPSIQLNEGDFINIPAHKKHKVAWTDPDNETIWLAVHY
ncbi:cupin domain-containing protein [Nitrosomonas sp. Nm166]|uniref:cupin domain-containing protein n=1 Tax=Nitrosomonas sp. Nm166 TaxID=1881054 RepID=UPI0008E89A62|nr:cupin domain-containing protein [Nitrosomonas sp. Nm166]SFD95071.1 cupin 2 domain-containing protein [Nitrosomonas sp. Nm166]